jgi:hypothetical protein
VRCVGSCTSSTQQAAASSEPQEWNRRLAMEEGGGGGGRLFLRAWWVQVFTLHFCWVRRGALGESLSTPGGQTL